MRRDLPVANGFEFEPTPTAAAVGMGAADWQGIVLCENWKALKEQWEKQCAA